MYGILGEDESDVATLRVIVRRLARNNSLPVKVKGYGGCGELLRDGARQLRLFQGLKCTRFIVCHDADGPDPLPKRELVQRRIIRPSGIREGFCIVIPVQELEAWVLADVECATNLFSSWRPAAIDNPEHVAHPKEHLERLSRDSKQRPRYIHAIHNEKMARHLDLQKVSRKCPAFRELEEFIA